MASKITIKLSDRYPKRPLKKLPPTMELSPDTPIDTVKMYVARKTGLGDHNRVGLYDPSTKTTLKDRKATIGSLESVMAAGELLVKDLGFQIDWTTVFVVEYLGPILIHCAVLRARLYIYPGYSPDAVPPISSTQWLAFAMVVSHFCKRELETLFVHKFSAATMPWTNIFKNSFFYWAVAGLLAAYTIYAPWSLAASATELGLLGWVGTALFLFGEVSNAQVHLYLSSLRSRGGTERKIPKGYGFSLVTSPNYMFEVIAWVGVIVAARSWALAIFIAMGAAQMAQWGRQKERAYRKEFPETYKKKKYVMLPGIV